MKDRLGNLSKEEEMAGKKKIRDAKLASSGANGENTNKTVLRVYHVQKPNGTWVLRKKFVREG
jgi:hypothetical protein